MTSKKIHVLIISQYFPPDISGGGTRTFNYAKCLAQQNYDVTVITAHPHLHSSVPKEYKRKLIHREKKYGLKIVRVWIPSLLHTSVRNRIFLHFTFILYSLLPLFSVKPDVIVASEPNLFSIIPAFIYSKLRGGKVIRIVDDMWPEAIYDWGYAKSRLLKIILDKLAKFSYSYPKYILPLTNEAKDYISNFYGESDKKIIVLEHGINMDVFTFQKKKRKNQFILMYSGAIAESYDFDIIINAAKKLKNENITFVVRGKGNLFSYLKKKKEELHLNNLVLDSNIVAIENLSKVLGGADVFLVPMHNTPSINWSLPTKILEYQAIGRPVICCSNGAPGNYVEKSKSGIKVRSGDQEKFIEAIMKLKSNPTLCTTLGENGRKFILENLTLEKIGGRLSEIIQRTMNNQ